MTTNDPTADNKNNTEQTEGTELAIYTILTIEINSIIANTKNCN